MRYFFRPHRAPQVRKVLLIESGSRELIENLIPQLPGLFGGPVLVDLITCFGGLPKNFQGNKVYRVSDYGTPELRASLYRELQIEYLPGHRHDLQR